MSSFSCPHFDPANDWCMRLKTDCVPGRAGCVLAGKVTFVVPAEERVRAREETKKSRLEAGRGDEMPRG